MRFTMRIAVAAFMHETCTFCPRPTTIEDFEYYGVPRGEAVLKMARGTPHGRGVIKVAEVEPDVELVGILAAVQSRGGTSGSWLTPACFDRYSLGIAEGIKTAGDIDGVLLILHGAMAVTGVPRPEAEIVRRVRTVVGPDVPIMVTLDLHANEDHALIDAADGVFIMKTYPHVDQEAIGMLAARCLVATVRGAFTPTMALRKPGIVTPSVFPVRVMEGGLRSPGVGTSNHRPTSAYRSLFKYRSAATIRLARARICPNANSATASMSSSQGVMVTRIFRADAASTATLLNPTPYRAMIFSFVDAAMSPASMRLPPRTTASACRICASMAS